jgi:FAD/FMN-containing dehydrogenase
LPALIARRCWPTWRAVCRRRHLLSADEDLKPYECDGLSAYRQVPLAVALPETEAQVVAVIKACRAAGAPIVARGAGTGLSAGALPHPQGVVLSLAKLKKILHVDPVARVAVVQPGVRNLAISEAAAPLGLYYAPDPSSQIACSIGGNVAENSGGVHCLKYGLTLHNVLRVRAVMIAATSSSSATMPSMRRATTCWRCPSVPRACSRWSPRSRSSWCRSPSRRR